jgi:uncharacterized membrane protein YkvA (DUF1232 family)
VTTGKKGGGESRMRELKDLGREVVRLMMDPKVPMLTKLIPILAIVYLLSPIDLIPDTIPLVTQIDDIAVLLIAARIFLQLAPDTASEDDDTEREPATVDATYRVHEE